MATIIEEPNRDPDECPVPPVAAFDPEAVELEEDSGPRVAINSGTSGVGHMPGATMGARGGVVTLAMLLQAEAPALLYASRRYW